MFSFDSIRLFSLAFCVVLSVGKAGFAQTSLGSAFTYQGQLRDAGAPAQGAHDLQFRLFDAAAGGAQVGTTDCVDGVEPRDGLFTVELDFGPAAFDGSAQWLEVAVRADTTPANCTSGVYTTLTTRQPITAAPYSLQTRGIFVDGAGNVGIGTTSPAGTFDVLRASSGNAARFVNSLSSNAFATLSSEHMGSGPAILGTNRGTGRAGDFRILAPENANAAVRGLNQGVGCAGVFEITSAANTSPAVYAQTGAALGYAGYFLGGRNYFEGDVGIGTATPAATLDVRGDIKLGADGELFAQAGVENLRTIRGRVSFNGGVVNGSGFTVVYSSTGVYRINFVPPFSDEAVVTATPYGVANARVFVTCDPEGAFATVHGVLATATVPVDTQFCFVAVGPR